MDILNLIISKTHSFDKECLQIISSDGISVNVVLVAEKIIVKDEREEDGP